jgi:hypothetical protein
MVITMSFGATATAQEAQPTQDPAQLVPNDPTAPQGDEEEPAQDAASTPVATEEPEAEPTSEAQQTTTTSQPRLAERAEDAAGPGAPAVLAHGLAYVSGDDMVWQVRQVEVPDVGDAQADTSDEAALLQRDGSSVIRNNATGKRALINPGEAFFRASDDSYTVMSEDDGSVIWWFELVDPDDVDLDAFYESPVIGDVDEGVYDMMMTRYVLQAGESADLPDHSGAGLIMPTSGEVQVDMDGELSVLGSGDGQSLRDDTMVTNDGTRPAVFVYVYLGQEVSDATAGAAQGSTNATTDTTTASDGTSGTTSTNTADTTEDGSLQDEADTTADTQEAAPATTTEDGAYITSINVTADAEIYLTISVDGLTVFDGILPAGASSGPVVGTTFEVYTSSGVNTNFTNACGDYFKMGYEEGEAYYALAASESSCAP